MNASERRYTNHNANKELRYLQQQGFDKNPFSGVQLLKRYRSGLNNQDLHIRQKVLL